jgi:hypothetical protein
MKAIKILVAMGIVALMVGFQFEQRPLAEQEFARAVPLEVNDGLKLLLDYEILNFSPRTDGTAEARWEYRIRQALGIKGDPKRHDRIGECDQTKLPTQQSRLCQILLGDAFTFEQGIQGFLIARLHIAAEYTQRTGAYTTFHIQDEDPNKLFKPLRHWLANQCSEPDAETFTIFDRQLMLDNLVTALKPAYREDIKDHILNGRATKPDGSPQIDPETGEHQMIHPKGIHPDCKI